MIEKIIGVLKSKSFWIGFVLAIGVFSQYIFGPDNLAEEFAESIFKQLTGQEIDFSPK